MIKAKLITINKNRKEENKIIYFLGLSADNIWRLTKYGEQIMFNMTELGFPENTGDIIVAYGRTEQDIREWLLSLAPREN